MNDLIERATDIINYVDDKEIDRMIKAKIKLTTNNSLLYETILKYTNLLCNKETEILQESSIYTNNKNYYLEDRYTISMIENDLEKVMKYWSCVDFCNIDMNSRLKRLFEYLNHNQEEESINNLELLEILVEFNYILIEIIDKVENIK